jgi:hypothetical protein
VEMRPRSFHWRAWRKKCDEWQRMENRATVRFTSAQLTSYRVTSQPLLSKLHVQGIEIIHLEVE